MRRAWNVSRRELATFFDHPTAYVLVVAFLGLGLFLTFRTLYATGIATMRPFFDMLPWLFAVFVPAMTMRSLAEERRSGTLEWLLAHPLGEIEVIAGKFVGNWIFALIALAGTLPTALGLLWVSEADGGIIVAEYVGAALLAAQGVAIGLWASSLTRNQITAFIVAASASFFLVLIGTPVVLIGLPPAPGSLRLAPVGRRTLLERGQGRHRPEGRHLLPFHGGPVPGPGDRSAEPGASLPGAGLVPPPEGGDRGPRGRGGRREPLGGNIRGRLDLTRGGLYTLSGGTRAILGELDDIVTLKLVVSDELPTELAATRRDVQDLVADLRRAAQGQLVVESLNPGEDDEAATEARSLGITENEFNVLRDDEFEVRRGWFGLALLYADSREVIPYIDRTDDLEFRIVSAISTMTSTERPRLTFATGFGAESGAAFTSFRQDLSDRYDVRTADLSGDTVPGLGPDTIDILILAGPDQVIGDAAVESVRSYVGQGGAALFLLDNHQVSPESPTTVPVTTGLEGFLEEYGIRMDAGMVLDYSSNSTISMGRQGIFNLVRPYPLWPIGAQGRGPPDDARSGQPERRLGHGDHRHRQRQRAGALGDDRGRSRPASGRHDHARDAAPAQPRRPSDGDVRGRRGRSRRGG